MHIFAITVDFFNDQAELDRIGLKRKRVLKTDTKT